MRWWMDLTASAITSPATATTENSARAQTTGNVSAVCTYIHVLVGTLQVGTVGI